MGVHWFLDEGIAFDDEYEYSRLSTFSLYMCSKLSYTTHIIYLDVDETRNGLSDGYQVIEHNEQLLA